MFNKNFKRKVFSLVIIAMLFSSSVSFGSGFGTYKFMIPIFSNFNWRQIPIFSFFEPKKTTLPIQPEEPVEEEPEAPAEEEPETPEEPVEEVEEPEVPEEIEKPEKPERPEKPEQPGKPEQPEQPEQPIEEEKPVEEKPEEPKEEQPEEKPVENETPSGVSREEQEVLRLVNIERQKAGLQPFKLSAELSHVARDKSKDMAHNNYFSHQSPTHGSPFDMMKAYGINYRTAGENIAKGYNSPESVVNGWMNSPGHRANILNSSFNTLGVGYYNYNGTAYWTQMFTN